MLWDWGLLELCAILPSYAAQGKHKTFFIRPVFGNEPAISAPQTTN